MFNRHKVLQEIVLIINMYTFNIHIYVFIDNHNISQM